MTRDAKEGQGGLDILQVLWVVRSTIYIWPMNSVAEGNSLGIHALFLLALIQLLI